MNRSLAKYNPPAKISGTTLLIGAVLIGLLIWFIKSKSAQAGSYNNKEEWQVTYDEDGLPTKIIITRNAVRT